MGTSMSEDELALYWAILSLCIAGSALLTCLCMTAFVVYSKRFKLGTIRRDLTVLVAFDISISLRIVTFVMALPNSEWAAAHARERFLIGNISNLLCFFGFCLVSLQWYTVFRNVKAGNVTSGDTPRPLLYILVTVCGVMLLVQILLYNWIGTRSGINIDEAVKVTLVAGAIQRSILTLLILVYGIHLWVIIRREMISSPTRRVVLKRLLIEISSISLCFLIGALAHLVSLINPGGLWSMGFQFVLGFWLPDLIAPLIHVVAMALTELRAQNVRHEGGATLVVSSLTELNQLEISSGSNHALSSLSIATLNSSGNNAHK